MGAWGIGIYENDSALDWAARRPTLDRIELTLNGVDWDEEDEAEVYLDEPEILAAADTLLGYRVDPDANAPRVEMLTGLAIERLNQFLNSDHYERRWPKEDHAAKRAEVARGVLASLENHPSRSGTR